MFDPTTVTVANFQAQFFRDFPYLDAIIYNPLTVYNQGNEVWYPPSNAFWSCLQNQQSGITPGTNSDVWVIQIDNIDNYIQDQDITNAFAEAQVLFNTALFTSDANAQLGYLYLTAHFLCNDLKAAQGGFSSLGGMPVSARTVGSVSESYQIPDAFKDSPILAGYTQSMYGMKYLAMILPQMTGNMAAVFGGSLP